MNAVSGFAVERSHHCPCEHEPTDGVTYPPFVSGKPLYGRMRVDMSLLDRQSGTSYHFALDESGGTGAGYDRLYIDLNCDGDLSNERAITPLDNPPEGALSARSGIEQQVCFRYVTFSSVGDANETYSAETMPRLTVSDKGYAVLWFVATKAYEGEIEIAGQRYSVMMANSHPFGTHWDRPETFLELRSQDEATRLPRWVCSDRLMAMHKIGGKYWCLSTTPTGDRLFVAPYTGEFGTLAMGRNWSLGGKCGFAGVLLAQDKAVHVGNEDRNEPVRSCRIPAGDYAPEMFAVYDGSQVIQVSTNYHGDGKPREREKPVKHAFAVRKDKPYVLDFSGRAEVLFALPARDTRVRPGQDLVVKAVLVDPKLDIMLRDLRTKSSVEGDILSPGAAILMAVVLAAPLVVWLFAGKLWKRHRFVPILSISGLVILGGLVLGLHIVTMKVNSSGRDGRVYHDKLIPQVAIYRSDGGIVARGGLPFG